MKKQLFGLSILAAFLSTSTFAAGPVANIQVTGDITPPTCLINGATEDTFTYDFDISPGIFPASGNLVLDAQSQNIEVVCDATTYLSFTAVDNRSGTELTAGDTNFGLSTYGADNVGFYTVTMSNATVKTDPDADAKTAGVMVGSSSGTKKMVSKSQRVTWVNASGSWGTQSFGQIFAADFAVTPTINGVLKNSVGDASLDGEAVLTFAFGV